MPTSDDYYYNIKMRYASGHYIFHAVKESNKQGFRQLQ
jgi:hypothetical protein